MNKKDLLALRKEKENAMANIVETRSEDMTEEVMETLKTFKEEILEIDRKIEAIDELRSVAIKNSAPVEVQKADKEAELNSEFRNYIVGDSSFREFEKRASTLVTDSANIVPDAFIKNLQAKILEYGSLYGSVSKLQTADNGQVQIPTIDDTTSVGAWTDEGGTYSTADFATGSITMDAHKMTTHTQVSEELLHDSFFDIESYIAKAFALRIARTVEESMINGDGIKKPLGILNDTSTLTYTSATAGAVTSTDLLTAVFSLQPTARKNAVIYVSDDLLKDLALEVDANGRPMLQAQANSTVANAPKHTIGGYPVVVNYALGTVATGNVAALIGDPKAYTIRNVKGIEVKRDEYTDMATGMVNFYASLRLDGKIINVNDSFVKVVVG